MRVCTICAAHRMLIHIVIRMFKEQKLLSRCEFRENSVSDRPTSFGDIRCSEICAVKTSRH
jgi:hypothetical protein